jgi:hypothetical protein
VFSCRLLPPWRQHSSSATSSCCSCSLSSILQQTLPQAARLTQQLLEPLRCCSHWIRAVRSCWWHQQAYAKLCWLAALLQEI